MSDKQFSFLKGYNQVPVGASIAARDEIMQKLKLNSLQAWRMRLYGNVEPRVSEADIIVEVLSKYGVTENIWGE